MMEQPPKNYNSILWILFGIVIFSAIHAVIEALIYLYFHYGISNRFVDIHFKYYIPFFGIIITFLISLMTTFLIKKKLKNFNLNSSKIPWLLFVVLIIIGVLIPFIAKYLSDKKTMALYDDLSITDYLTRLNFSSIFETIDYSIIGTKWLLFIFMLAFFLFLRRKAKTS